MEALAATSWRNLLWRMVAPDEQGQRRLSELLSFALTTAPATSTSDHASTQVILRTLRALVGVQDTQALPLCEKRAFDGLLLKVCLGCSKVASLKLWTCTPL